MRNFLLFITINLFLLKGLMGQSQRPLIRNAKDWMPNGVRVDKLGNVSYDIGRFDQSRTPDNMAKNFTFHGEVRRKTQIVNLSKKEVFILDPNQAENAPPPNDGSGFLVSKEFRLGDWGFGLSEDIKIWGDVEKQFFKIDYGTGPFAGMSFEIGAGLMGTLFVKKYSDIKKLPKIITLPTTIKALNKFKVGDRISYYINGGIGVAAGFGVGVSILPLIGASFGPDARLILSGTWYCEIQKTGLTTVSVRYTKRKLKKVIAQIGLSVIQEINALKFKKMSGLDKGIFYEFNLADPQGRKAFKWFLMGNTAKASKLAHKLKAAKAFALSGVTTRNMAKRIMKSAVRPLDFSKMKVKLKEKSVLFSIPGIATMKMKRIKSRVASDYRPINDNSTLQTTLGIYGFEREIYGWRDGNRNQLSLFIGSLQNIKKVNLDGTLTLTRRYSGNFKYEHHAYKLKEGDLERELMYVMNEIGQKEKILNLKIPQVPVNLRKYLKIGDKKVPLGLKPKKKTLGYAALSVDLIMSMDAIDNLKSQALFGKAKGWKKIGDRLVNNWFSNKENQRWEICTTLFKGKKSVMGRKICKGHILRKTKRGLKLAKESLIRMQRALADGNDSIFAKEFSFFGKGLMTNQFTLTTLLKALSHGDVHLVLSYKGERVPRGELVLIQSKKRKFKGLKVID